MVTPEIIANCKAKDQHAFKLLYEACLPYVFTIVKGYTDNPDFRKDLVQEIFAKVFLNIRQYDESKGEFKPWLRKLAANQCLLFLRDKMKFFQYDDLDITHEKKWITSINFNQLDKEKGVVQQLLKQMPIGYRQVFSLIVMEGYSHHEVGKHLGITTASSRSQLARSKKWLRNHLKSKNLFQNERY